MPLRNELLISRLEEVHGGEAGDFADALPEVRSESEVAGPERVP